MQSAWGKMQTAMKKDKALAEQYKDGYSVLYFGVCGSSWAGRGRPDLMVWSRRLDHFLLSYPYTSNLKDTSKSEKSKMILAWTLDKSLGKVFQQLTFKISADREIKAEKTWRSWKSIEAEFGEDEACKANRAQTRPLTPSPDPTPTQAPKPT